MQIKSIHSIVKEKFLRKIFKFLKIFKKKKIIKTIDINNFTLLRLKIILKKLNLIFFKLLNQVKSMKTTTKNIRILEKNPEFNFYFFDDLDMDDYMEKLDFIEKFIKSIKIVFLERLKQIFGDTVSYISMVVFI